MKTGFLIINSSMPTKKIPPPSGADMESLEDPVAFEGGVILPAYNTFTSDI